MTKQIGNISADKIELALDTFMGPAIKAIDGCSDLYAITVSNALAAKAFDVRHRPSRSNDFFEDAATFLINRDINLGLRLKLNHDRTIAMCTKFMLSTAGVDQATHQAAQLNSSALNSMGDSVMSTAPGRLFLARCEVEYAMRYVRQLREAIAEKFMRFATQQAAMHVKTRKGVNYEVASNQAKQGVYTAIDRYSSERGALASYVNMWVRQALLDKTNLQEGAAVEFSSGGPSHISTSAVSIDSENLQEILAHVTDGYADRHAEHTRALSTIPALRPVLRSTGESLRYPLNNRERSLLQKVA